MWVPVDTGATVYVGSIAGLDYSDIADAVGVTVWDQADGASNTSNIGDIPFGVVIGTNLRTPAYDSTAKAHYITAGTATSPRTSSSVEYVGVEGPFSKGENRAMVKLDLIGPHSKLRAPLYNNAVGTAPTLLTCTTGDAQGDAVTTNATQYTPVDNMSTIYCRSGANAGIYRITSNTSTTAHTWNVDMNAATAVGDTFVSVGLRPFGTSFVRFGDDTYCSYINVSETPATNYTIIHVTKLDLSVAGKEYCEFYFDADVFATARA